MNIRPEIMKAGLVALPESADPRVMSILDTIGKILVSHRYFKIIRLKGRALMPQAE